jgi:hypothetical protein
VFLGGSPARILVDRRLRLDAAARRDPLAVEAFRQRLLAEDRVIDRLLGPDLALPEMLP